VRRRLAAIFIIVGAALSLAAGGRYARGWYRRDQIRQQWAAMSAKADVASARALVESASDQSVSVGSPVARLVIARIKLDEVVVEGVGSDELNAAPGHLPGSALPGLRGNAIISAHRDRHFDRLGELQVGDTIETETRQRRNQWVVVQRRVIDEHTPALFSTSTPTLTLTTCWPIRFFGPAPDRLIVTARPVIENSHTRAL
jgi:LPXTG-site transpeptidase (sortase) family protein